MTPLQPVARSTSPLRRRVLRTSLARLVASLYGQAGPRSRQQLLDGLLRPVGPLALVAIAAGAFGRLLPATRWPDAVRVSLDDVQRFSAQQVFELVRYVEQKSPELLLQLPDLVTDRPLWTGTLAGVLLLATLHAAPRRRPTALPS